MQKPSIDAVPDPVGALSTLLDHLYAGIEQPARWQCLLDELTPMLGLRHLAFIIFRPGIYSLEVRSGTSREVLERLRAKYQGENIIRTTPVRNGLLLTGALLDSRDYLEPAVVEASDFRRDIMQPTGVDYFTLAVASGMDAPLEPEVMLILGHGSGEDLTPVRRSLLRALLPHLRRAVLMRMAVDFRYTAETLTGMQSAQCGHLLVDSQGAAVIANRHALKLLALPVWQLQSGELHLRDARIDRQLHRSIRGVAAGRLRTARLRVPLAESAVVLHFSPHVVQGQERCFVVVLLLQEADLPDQSGESVDSLANTCSLTDKERLVLVGLSQGHNLRDIAAGRGVSFNTVRAQLRSIYAKTGIRSQRELILRLKR